MISFMLIGMPRSGTTWAANWLTTEKTLCLHDPLWLHHYEQWDSIPCDRMLGISCTGIGFWPEWLNKHPARKVILHRPVQEVNWSLHSTGLPHWDKPMDLNAIEGLHVHWKALFEAPEQIYSHLFPGEPFDADRHYQLRAMNIEPHVPEVEMDSMLQARLMSELASREIKIATEVNDVVGS